MKLAIHDIEPFLQVYEKFKDSRVPARAALIDALTSSGVSQSLADEGADTLIQNLKFVGLMQTLSGAERIVSLDHLLDG